LLHLFRLWESSRCLALLGSEVLLYFSVFSKILRANGLEIEAIRDDMNEPKELL
jgi:hypothetical protein